MLELPAVESIDDPALAARLQQLLDGKTKPLGALGRLEALALRLGLILGSEAPAFSAPQMLVCAGDHGLAARGVSAYPSDVTWQMDAVIPCVLRCEPLLAYQRARPTRQLRNLCFWRALVRTAYHLGRS